MKRFLILACLLISCLSAADFEQLLGKGSEVWKEVRTDEDRAYVAFYKALYEKEYEGKGSIPKKLHFIWLGPDLFPEASIKRLKAWQRLHPDWTFYFWTDANQAAPFPFLVHRIVSDVHLAHVDKAFNVADTFREKAFLLSLEILICEGGVVVDHDVTPLAPLDPLQEGVDFYASLAPLRPSTFSSSVMLDPYLLAARSDHPFILEAAGWYAEQGEKFETFFAGTSPSQRIRRTNVRLYESLRNGSMHLGVLRDRVYPEMELKRFVKHEGLGTWKRLETVREQKMRMKIEGINRQMPYVLILIVLCVVMALGTIVLARRKK